MLVSSMFVVVPTLYNTVTPNAVVNDCAVELYPLNAVKLGPVALEPNEVDDVDAAAVSKYALPELRYRSFTKGVVGAGVSPLYATEVGACHAQPADPVTKVSLV